MLKLCLFFIACLCIPIVISWGGLMLGPGQWLVEHIGQCENPETYEFVYEIIRKKINRTHDSYAIIFQCDREFNSSIGGPIIIRDFVMDYRELAKDAIYGTFQAYTFATFKKKKIGCVKIILNFDKRNDDDDDFSLI